MRVLYLLHNAVRGGSAGSLRLLISHFPPGSVEAHVAMPAGPAVKSFRDAGIKVHPISGVSMLLALDSMPLKGRRLLLAVRAIWNARHGRALARILREVRPDVVHLNERGMLQAARLAHRAGCAVVMHARSVADRETLWLMRMSKRMIDAWVDRMVAIDKSVRWSIREIEPVDVVYNPLAMLEWSAPVANRRGEPRPVCQVSYVSGLIGAKGIWDVVHAAEILRNRKDIVFNIAGENARPRAFYSSIGGRLTQMVGLAHDLERDLAHFVAERGLSDTVRLLGHVENVPELLRSSDMVVFPGHTNGVSRSTYEAGVFGVPSIVSLRDRITDIVEDGVTGLVVPEHDPSAIAHAIERLADDPDLRARLGEEARRRFVGQFDPGVASNRLLEIYRDVLVHRGA